MAVDVTNMNARAGNGKLQGAQDPRVMQRAGIICGIALAVLIAIRTGFMEKVLP